MDKNDILPLLEINTANIFSNFRPSLISDLKDFQNEFLKQAKNDFLKVFWVNGKQEGYFRIYSQNKKDMQVFMPAYLSFIQHLLFFLLLPVLPALRWRL